MHENLARSGRGLVMFAIASMLSLAQTASAQSRPSPAVEFAAGAFLFPDDALVTETLFGGSGRIYLSPRISIGPEVAFGDGTNRRHLMLTGNITFDLLPPSQGSPRRITPFVVIGAGLFRTTEDFPGSADFSSSEGAFTAGGGVRGFVARRVYVGGEVRVGWETHIRVNGLVGLVLGGD